MADLGPLYAATFAPDCDDTLALGRRLATTIGRGSPLPKDHRLAHLLSRVERDCAEMKKALPSKHPREFVELRHTSQMLHRWSSDPSWKDLLGHLGQELHYLHDIFTLAAGDVLRRYGNRVRLTSPQAGAKGTLAHPDLHLEVVGSSPFAVEVKSPSKMLATRPETLTAAEASARILRYARDAVRQVGTTPAILVLGGLRYPKRNLRILARAVPHTLPTPFVGVMVLSLGLADDDMHEEVPADPRASVWVRFGVNLNPHALMGAIPSQMICASSYKGVRPGGFEGIGAP